MEATPTLRERMMMLNLDQIQLRSGPASHPLAKKPMLPLRSTSTGAIRNQNGPDHPLEIANLPAAPLPSPPIIVEKLAPPSMRRVSAQSPPNLPLRPQGRPTEPKITRRGSQESISSTISAVSTSSSRTTVTVASRTPSFDCTKARPVSAYVIKAPEYDPSSLPKLPPKAGPRLERPSLSVTKSHTPSSLVGQCTKDKPQPPPLPSRRQLAPLNDLDGTAPPDITFQNKITRPRVDPRSRGFQINPTQSRSSLLQSSTQNLQNELQAAPPIPSGSRPDMSQLQATKLRPASFHSTDRRQTCCLKCRDFAQADAHTAQFPRQSLPSNDTSWIAHQLCDPFPSLTDKARVIFTWLHHNIAYDCKAFFAGNVRPSSPSSTMASGLAVCEGYAALFTALATKAGMESIVVGGHGKGFGHRPLDARDRLPAFDANHAWNAVRIDDGEWKLIDTCWGAGHLDASTRTYRQGLNTACFTMDNDEFGLRHFPTDRNFFFRSDGRALTWEEYCIGPDGPGEPLELYGGVVGEHGLSPTSFLPSKRHLRITGLPPSTSIQFQFERVCEHFDPEQAGLGKPYVYALAVGGRDGKNRTIIPLKTTGSRWRTQIAVDDLGCKGQTIQIYAVTSVDGRDGKGMTVEYVKTCIGRRPMAFAGVCSWQLV